MKATIALVIVLAVTWMLWSGHTEPFLVALGAASIGLTVGLVRRMRILDDEAAPTEFGLRPLFYLPYLIKEIARSNWEVVKIVCSPSMRLQRNLVQITSRQRTDVGRVVLANSVTLTPGTVTVRVEGDQLLVHALSFVGGEEDLSGEMDRRICRMEGER